jgi:Fe2+ or Zn2+ uptake regulation protein
MLAKSSNSKIQTTQGRAEILEKVGILPIDQRCQITGIALQGRQHVSAEELYRQLQHKARLASKAAAYNILKILVKHGLIREVRVDSSQVFLTQIHYHLTISSMWKPESL